MGAKGSLDDYRVYTNLADCQELLGQGGKINLILAFECLHGRGTLQEMEQEQRRKLDVVLPGFKQITKTDIARGRFMARQTTHHYLYYLLGIVFCITVAVILITGLQEVSERKNEIGILISMGTNYSYIIALYITKILAIACIASVAGFLGGSYLSVWLMSPVLLTQTRPVAVLWSQFPHVVGLTCAVAIIAELIPMVKLVRMDPNVILTEG